MRIQNLKTFSIFGFVASCVATYMIATGFLANCNCVCVIASKYTILLKSLGVY